MIAPGGVPPYAIASYVGQGYIMSAESAEEEASVPVSGDVRMRRS
jgi:hypothetical protein